MKKDFSKIDPTEKFFGAAEQKEEQIEISSRKKKTKTNSDYLRLDICDYKEYLATMAGFQRTSVTKYIQSLIAEDMQKNKEIYGKLQDIQLM